MRNIARTLATVALAAVALTACGSAPVPGEAGYVPTRAVASPVPVATGAPVSPAPTAPADTTGPTAVLPASGDPVLALARTVAEQGLANAGLMDDAEDSRDELLAPARTTLTPEGLRRYEETLAPVGHPESTSLRDGHAYQLVAFSAYAPGHDVRSARVPLVGPLAVQETDRRVNGDGSVDVAVTAVQSYAGTRVADAVPVRTTMTRAYVLRVVPAPTADGAFLVDDWAGTRTTLSPWVAA